jgi:hypothetical protein
MVADIFASGPLTDLINNAAGNFISRTQDLSPRGFNAVANIVMHGTFYVTHAVGKRWIAGGNRGNVVSIVVTWIHNGGPLRGAVGHEQVGRPYHDHVACHRMGRLWHQAQRHCARRDPDRRREQALESGRDAAPRGKIRWAGSAAWRNCRTSQLS